MPGKENAPSTLQTDISWRHLFLHIVIPANATTCTQAEVEALLHGPVAARIAALQAQRGVDELALEAAHDADDQLNAALRALQFRCVWRSLSLRCLQSKPIMTKQRVLHDTCPSRQCRPCELVGRAATLLTVDHVVCHLCNIVIRVPMLVPASLSFAVMCAGP